MFMLAPHRKTFDMLVNGIKTWQTPPGHPKSGIQAFLNHMFPSCNSSLYDPVKSAGCWSQKIGWHHNKFTRELNSTEVLDIEMGKSKYGSIHYSGSWEHSLKPWMSGCMAQGDAVTWSHDLNVRGALL